MKILNHRLIKQQINNQNNFKQDSNLQNNYFLNDKTEDEIDLSELSLSPTHAGNRYNITHRQVFKGSGPINDT